MEYNYNTKAIFNKDFLSKEQTNKTRTSNTGLTMQEYKIKQQMINKVFTKISNMSTSVENQKRVQLLYNKDA